MRESEKASERLFLTSWSMNLKHHRNLTPEKWKSFPFYKQILMIGTEIARAGKWIEKEDFEEAKYCYERAIELIYLTVQTIEEKRRLREILRLKEAILSFYIKNPTLKENDNLLKTLLLMTKESAELLER